MRRSNSGWPTAVIHRTGISRSFVLNGSQIFYVRRLECHVFKSLLLWNLLLGLQVFLMLENN
jgi:hypothetical protein